MNLDLRPRAILKWDTYDFLQQILSDKQVECKVSSHEKYNKSHREFLKLKCPQILIGPQF